jgi:two-component system sensor histidine kinase LytS
VLFRSSDHHFAPKDIITDLTHRCLTTQEPQIVRNKKEIGCPNPDCPLAAAIVVPLFIQGNCVGSMKFYFDDPSKLTNIEELLAKGLGSIFSSQLELGELDKREVLMKEAEIKVLQSQISPHFFFNAINTINTLIRIDSEKARQMLLQLGNFFRYNLMGIRSETISLEEEIKHVQAYLAIEQARFPDRWTVNYFVDENLNKAQIPPFVLQILVENAIKHAFLDRRSGNVIDIRLIKIEDKTRIEVEDNGYGIDKEKIHLIGKEEINSEHGTGTALENLNNRLISIYGESEKLQFETSETGTIFWMDIPYKEVKKENENINH